MTPDLAQIASALVGGLPDLSPEDQRLALSLYRLLATGRPASPEAIAAGAGWAVDDVGERLDAWPAVFRDPDGAVTGFWGLAIEEVTSHRLDLDDTAVWAWCAYDTLFLPQLLGATAQVSSRCPTTGQSVRLTVSPESVSGLEPAEAVVSLLTPDGPIDDNVRQTLCHFVHFFASPGAADTWTTAHPGTFSVPVSDAFEIAHRQNAAMYASVIGELRATGPAGGGQRQRHRGAGDYDLAVVGSGGAAFAAAIRATSLGARVAVVERGPVGGTCVNVGCVPSKTLLAAADAYHRAGHHPFEGVPTEVGPVDLAALVGQKDELVAGLRQAKYLDLAADYGFEIIEGAARFTAPDLLDVGGRSLRAGAYLIATGAEPAVPDLPGLVDAGYLTSTTAMALTERPGNLVVIGAGFVGMEQSQLFARLGSHVHLVGGLAPRAEPEMADWMTRVLADDGIELHATRATKVSRSATGVTVTCEDGTTCAGDALLAATGRRPRTDGLGLDAAGVTLDEHGFVVVDGHQHTTNPAIWAAGDVTGGPQFVYVAAAQGTVAAHNAIGGTDRTVDYTGLPSVVFTTPQLASAGVTEHEAVAAGHRCECRVVQLDQIPRALANRDTRGAIKVVIDADTRRVLGVHAVADGAGDVMLAATYAIKFGLTVEQLADTWAPYLTMSEALRLTAQSFRADIKKLSCCAA